MRENFFRVNQRGVLCLMTLKIWNYIPTSIFIHIQRLNISKHLYARINSRNFFLFFRETIQIYCCYTNIDIIKKKIKNWQPEAARVRARTGIFLWLAHKHLCRLEYGNTKIHTSRFILYRPLDWDCGVCLLLFNRFKLWKTYFFNKFRQNIPNLRQK